MATLKSYTDIEQSKKLAEILPLESADMIWANDNDVIVVPYDLATRENILHDFIPCWSLAALISILPTLDGRNANFCKDIRYDKWHVYYHSTASLSIIDTERYDNIIDACYEMVLKLNELKQI